MLDPAPPPGQEAGSVLPAAEVVSIGSSCDGAHRACIRAVDGADRELLVAVLVDRGRVQVRIEAARAAAPGWLQEREGRIREALDEAGLELASLDLRQRDGGHDGRQGSGGSRDRRR